MQRFLLRVSALVITAVFSVLSLCGQETDTTKPGVSVDPKLLEWRDAKLPKEYTISSIKITGVKYYDTAIIASISGLQAKIIFQYPDFCYEDRR
jgi:outer membrane protein insertion porin family